MFYGLPILNIVFDRFEAALIAFIINYAAYYAEIFREGSNQSLQGNTKQQKFCASTLCRRFGKIIIPQVVKITLPSVGNEVINLVKDTSLVHILGLSDVMRIGKIAMERDSTLVPLLGVALIYLMMTGIFTLIFETS